VILLLVGTLCAGVAAGVKVKPRQHGGHLMDHPRVPRALQKELSALQKLPWASRTVAAQVNFSWV
jgi:hypothetical protein